MFTAFAPHASAHCCRVKFVGSGATPVADALYPGGHKSEKWTQYQDVGLIIKGANWKRHVFTHTPSELLLYVVHALSATVT